MSTICIFGDSIAWGADDPEGGWCNKLRNHLYEKNDDVVYNLGFCGETSTELLKRIKNEAEFRRPDIIVIAIGINDSNGINSEDNFLVDIERFKINIKELAEIFQQIASKIIFIGPTNVNESKTTPITYTRDHFYLNKNIEKYNNVIKSYCQINDIEFIEVFGSMEDNDLDDGLHPNKQGHDKLLQKIKEKIK